MKVSAVKKALEAIESIQFILPSGEQVPSHFHLTEIGNITKRYIDCGGKIRLEDKVSFQLWTSVDVDHRLKAEKFNSIIELAEKNINLQDEEIEVEYQGDTIQKFGLEFDGVNFLLTNTHTDCLAKDNCGIPDQKVKINLAEVGGDACCGPGCC